MNRQHSSVDPPYKIVSAFPGRVRVRLVNRNGRNERLKRWADWFGAVHYFDNIEEAADAGSLILLFDAGRHSLESVLDRITETAVYADARKPPALRAISTSGVHRLPYPPSTNLMPIVSDRHPLRAKDLHAVSSVSFRNLLIPTAAVLLALVEFIPSAVVIVMIAASAAPSAKRAIRDLSSRKFSVDQLDLLNVTLATIDGALIPAAAISWLINLGEVLRARAMEKTRRRHVVTHEVSSENWATEYHPSTKLLLENALLTDTQFQGFVTKLHFGASTPFVGAAGMISFVTQDLGFIVGVLKPLYDFSAAVRFGVPAILLNTMASTAKHGPIFRSGSAVESLAKVDSIVFFTTSGFDSEKVFRKRMKQLLKRGINHFFLPTSIEAAKVVAIALSCGMSHVISEVLPDNPEHAIALLHRHGHRVAVVEDGGQEPLWVHRADVRIGLLGATFDEGQVDITMAHSDLRGIAHTIDLAKHAMELARQNILVSAISSVINLGLAVMPPLAATTVSTITTGVLALNIGRELEIEHEDDSESENLERPFGSLSADVNR